MTAPTPKPSYGNYYRVAAESAYGTGNGTADWNIGGTGGGAVGWHDAPVITNQAPIPAVETPIFAMYQAGKRGINQQAPVGGRQSMAHSLEMPVFPELIDIWIRALMGSRSPTETAGTAALSSTAFASVATLDMQPNGTEVLKFVIASSTAASSAAINIIQDAVTVETITIGTNAGTVNGTYYSKGAYNGSVNAITFSIAGTVTSGMVTVSGVDYVTNVFSMGSSNPSLYLEEAGLPRSASNSMYYDGVVVPQIVWNFDATAADGLLMATVDIEGGLPTAATAGTWGNEADLYYYPVAAWTASLTRDGSAYDKVQNASITINGGNHLYAVATGSQAPSGKTTGGTEVTGSITIIDEDATEWNDYVGQTVRDFHLTFTSPYNVVDSTPWSILMELTELFIESYTPTVINNLHYGATINFRTTHETTDGPIKITTVSRMPV
jgi:hypothetical protein